MILHHFCGPVETELFTDVFLMANVRFCLTNAPLLPRPVARLQSFGFSETISNSEVNDEFNTLCGRPRAMETC